MLSRWFARLFPKTRAPKRRTTRLNLLHLEDRVTPVAAFALSGTNLLSFDTVSPTILQTRAITGITAGESLVGIDFRPQNGLLYGLGVDDGADTATLYAISTRTGVAGVVGTASSIAFTTDGTAVVDLPDPATVGYGFDFNPAVDRIRVVAGLRNFRINPNTGLGVDGDNTGLTSGSVTGTNPDGDVNTGTTSVDAAGYTNNEPQYVPTPITTLYTLDAGSDSLYIQNPANEGDQTLVGALGVDFTSIDGFDVPAGVDDDASGTGVAEGSGFAVLNVGGTTGLYSIDLVTATATLVGNVGNGATAVQGLAIQSDLGGFSVVGLNAAGTSLVRFNTALPGTSITVPLGALAVGETLAAIDFRPQTGQFYGLGVNGTGNTATLYLIDPQTGAVTAVGTPGQITFQDGSASPVTVDLPPASAGYGMDFNPTVDRIRFTTSTGLNFRVNPNNGAPVDGDLGGSAGSVANVNTDGNVNGTGVTGVSATAYTNSFGQPLTGGVTSQYTLDGATDTLYIQTPPNSGSQTNPLPITVSGSPLNFDEVNGFDIPAGVRVTASGSPVASGFAIAVLDDAGNDTIYRIDLTTGEATSLGAAPAGLSGLTLADVPAGTVSFAATTSSIAENGGSATITLTRTGSSNGSLTVSVTTGGTATSGIDYTAGPFTATFADGATTASFVVPILDDTIFEGNETVVLTISAVDNAGIIGLPNAHTLTITENDAQQTFTVPAASGYALGATGTTLILLSSTAPGSALAPITITNVTAGETLVGIDFRPQNGLLYGLGVNATLDTATLYAISPRTGFATAVGTAGSIAFTTNGTTPVDLPDSATTGYDIDFNPAVDRLRVVAGSLNFRINPNDGLGVDGNNGGAAVGGTNPDGAINGGTTNVNGTAYVNNFANNGGVTTQFTLDPVTDRLFIQNPPNAGTQSAGLGITLGGSPLDFTAVKGFDILADVNAPASNLAPTAGTGLAVLTVGGTDVLYRIDLTTGAATVVGTIGATPATVSSVAFQSDLVVVPAIGLSANGTALLRATNPMQVFVVPVSGVASGETLVGIDFRPATGQLFGLGINATANTGTLYRIDPQSAAAIAIGTPGQIAFVLTDNTTAVDLPPDGYGFDFNPTVDRIRVTTASGLNFRINPVNGAPVDGNGDGSAPANPANGTNTDGNINGSGVTGVSATAYTNSFGTGGSPTTPAGVTSQYTLDATTNSLYIQTPPNAGTQTNPIPVTLNGSPLDFDAVNGFDIPGAIQVTASGTVAAGRGFAALTVASATGVYAIDLTTGAATLVGGNSAPVAGPTLAQSPTGIVAFTGATFNVGEAGPTAALTLTRTGGTSGALTVTVGVTGGTATAGTDFTAGPYTVTFADGATTATLNVPITNDAAVETDETIILTITNVSNTGVVGTQATATLTITDNDVTTTVTAVGPTFTFTPPGGVATTVTPFVGFLGTVSTGLGDVNNDGIDDVIVGASVSGHVKVFDGATGAEIRSFFPFVGFTGGSYVAGGDVSGDGVDDIIVGATINGHVKVFDGVTGAEIRSFLAYVNFAGEVRVGSGDIDGDGRDDIITGAGSGALGAVKVFSGANNAELRSFLAYTSFNGGIFVAGGDVNGDGRDDIVTGAEANGHVKVFSGIDTAALQSFFAFPGFVGAVRVAARDANGDGAADLIVGQGPGGTARVVTFDGLTLEVLSDVALADPLNRGVFVA